MQIKNIIFSASLLSTVFLHSFAVAHNNNTESHTVKNTAKTGAAIVIMGVGTQMGAMGGMAVGGALGFFTNLKGNLDDLGRGIALGGMVGAVGGGLIGLAASYVLAEKIIDGKQNNDANEQKKEELKEDLKIRTIA